MGICYDITDRFPEWDEFDADDFADNELFEETDYPELDDARDDAARTHPRGTYALIEVAGDLGKPDHFIGSDPTEMTIDVSREEFIEEFAQYKWVAGSEPAQFTMALSMKMIEVLSSWDREDLQAFYNEVIVPNDETGEWGEEGFDEFHSMVVEVVSSPGSQLLEQAFDSMVYPQLPEVGERWVVNAPLIDRVQPATRSPTGAADLDDAVFEDMYPKAYVLQEAEVMGFSPWWDDNGIDIEMAALAHPRMRVSFPDTGRQLIIGPGEAVAPVAGLEYSIPSVDSRSERLYPGGVLPKSGEVWLVSLPDEYEPYAGGVVPESAETGRTMRATVRKNVGWGDVDIELDKDADFADELYHPLMEVELDDGTQLILPPAGFMSRTE